MENSGKRTIRILHSGDIHLDTPFSSFDIRRSEIRKQELRAVFTSMMLYIRTYNIDIALLCGDLFDDGCATGETVELMIREFKKNSGCEFVISPGNHDPYTPTSVYAMKKFPENVHIFKSEALEKITLENKNADVYGWAFTSEGYTENPLAGKKAEETGRIKLLCCHCDTRSAVSRYCPVSEGDIVSFGADYAAMGHVHKTAGLKNANGRYYGYCGCPEGRSFDETGECGAFFAEITQSGGAVSVKPSKIGFSRRRYEVEKIDVTGALSKEEIKAAIEARISERKYGEETILRVILTGDVATDAAGVTFPDGSFPMLFMAEVKDATSPTFDGERLEGDLTLRGALYRTLLPMLRSPDPEVRENASLALRYGLSALSGNSVSDI